MGALDQRLRIAHPQIGPMNNLRRTMMGGMGPGRHRRVVRKYHDSDGMRLCIDFCNYHRVNLLFESRSRPHRGRLITGKDLSSGGRVWSMA